MAKAKAKIYARVLINSLEGATESKRKNVMGRFTKLLQKRGDLRKLSAILREADKLWQDKKGKLAQVVSAQGLSPEERTDVESFLRKKGYRMEEEADPLVIGGIALVLNNEFVIDGTIRGKLKRIARLATQIK